MASFLGTPKLEILPPPSITRWWEFLLPLRPQFRLLADFVYWDSRGRRWIAHKGTVVNGLSSPRFFWRLLPPLSWRGISASVIHDAYCIPPYERCSVDVHWVLWDCMRTDGVLKIIANVVWFLTRFGGPRFKAVDKNKSQKDRNDAE